MQTDFFKRKGIISLFAILIVVITFVLYFTTNLFQQESIVDIRDVTPTHTAVPPPTFSSVSPVSLISPTSASAPSEQTSALDEMFETGLQAYERGTYELAKDSFDAMISLNPNSARAYDARGTVHTALGEIENAINDYSKAIEIDPLYPPPYYNRGRMYSQLKKYNEALADLQRSIDLAPYFFGYRANGNIGLIYHAQGEYEKALEAFEQSINFDDTKADTFFYRGETYTALENYEAAIVDYQAATDRFSQYDLAYQSLGYAYYKTGQFDQALDALNQALQISPDSPIAHFYLGLVELALDDADAAQDAIVQAIDLIPTLSEAERSFILTRVREDMAAFAEEKPGQADAVKSLLDLIPEPE